jgi:hypothetical protein
MKLPTVLAGSASLLALGTQAAPPSSSAPPPGSA